MKNSLTLLLILIQLGLFAQKKKLNVTIDVSYKNSYCGGAKPSPEIQKKYDQVYKFKNAVLRLENTSAGKKEKPIFIKTDAEGKAHSTIMEGTYNVFVTKKFDKKNFTNLSASCAKMLKKSYGQITINKAGTQQIYKLALSFGCNPCGPAKK